MKNMIPLLFSFLCFFQAQSQELNVNQNQIVTVVHSDLNKFQNLRDFCISSDEKEAFFTVQSPNQELSKIVCVKNKKWDNPVIIPFCDGYSYLEPFLSSDGTRLYFASDRPKDKSETLKSDFDIWFVERKDKNSEWSTPINIGSAVNSKNDEFYPNLSDNNNLYFTMDSKLGLGKDDIYYCQWNGANYSKPILLSTNINSEGYEFNAFISKDENLLIYTKYNAKEGFGSGDLYMAKRGIDGEWQAAENLSNTINSKYMEYCPYYNNETNTLYFTSKRSNLAPKSFQNIEQYQQYITSGENGLSKIYQIKIKL